MDLEGRSRCCTGLENPDDAVAQEPVNGGEGEEHAKLVQMDRGWSFGGNRPPNGEDKLRERVGEGMCSVSLLEPWWRGVERKEEEVFITKR